MALTDKIRDVVLQDLSQIDVSELNKYAWENREIVKVLYDARIIDDSAIENALRSAVLKQARQDFNDLASQTSELFPYADSLPNSNRESLAYALAFGVFSDKEIDQIPFDHGDSPESFMSAYLPRDLLPSLRKEYLNPKPETYLHTHCECC
ncbi:MAG: hypothetical protein WCI72_02245 [archaeon]